MKENARTALVTGASGGIGYELVKLFAAEGYNLVLVARSEQKLLDLAADLTQTYGVGATVLAKDLSDPAAPDEIFARLQAESVAVDVLVNNAGFGVHGSFAETDRTVESNMVQVNVVALTQLCKLFLPGMIERGFGRILNVGSTGSFAPAPLMAVYAASKAYVLYFSEGIAEELKGTGVSVTALCPGVTRTGFQERADVADIRLVGGRSMSAKQVAKIGYTALMRGKPVVVSGWWNWLMAVSVRFVPRSLTRRMGYWLMKK